MTLSYAIEVITPVMLARPSSATDFELLGRSSEAIEDSLVCLEVREDIELALSPIFAPR
jgi:hypothetical protein